MDCVCLNNILIQILRFPYFLFTNSTGKNSFHRHFKGYRNEKFGWKKTLLFERTFEVIKIGLCSSRVSDFSLEIFRFV